MNSREFIILMEALDGIERLLESIALDVESMRQETRCSGGASEGDPTPPLWIRGQTYDEPEDGQDDSLHAITGHPPDPLGVFVLAGICGALFLIIFLLYTFGGLT